LTKGSRRVDNFDRQIHQSTRCVMPRSHQQNERLKGERREQIMQAALKVFALKGLAATKISDIAAACDLSYGLIYHYFHDKEEIYLALVERALQGTLRLSAQIAAQPIPAWERLRLLCAEMLVGARDTPEYFRLILQAQVNEQPPSAIHMLFARYSEQIWHNLTALIHQAQEEGEVVALDAGELAFTLVAAIEGISLSHTLATPMPVPFPSVETVLRFLRPAIPIHPDKESHHAN
jgi:AcrR family transcriptional regulator